MNTIVIEVFSETYQQLVKTATASGASPKELAEELIESIYGIQHRTSEAQKNDPHYARQVLTSAGLVVPLSEQLQRAIQNDISLEEIVEEMSQAAGLSLSELLDQQRGPHAP